MNEIKDYYEKLNCTINSSYRDIYLSFKRLAFPLHPDNPNSQRNDNLFKEYCEAYYVLEYREFREVYNKICKRQFFNENVDLKEEEINNYINTWEKEGLESGEKYLLMTFNKFKKNIPVKPSWLGITIDAMTQFISNAG